MRFLLFTLYAPLGACGEIAVGERRMGWTRPARSAVLGLVAAALGLDRADEAAHAALETNLGYAVRTDAPGRPFVDYHTAQVPSTRRGRAFDTRREQLAAEELNTILSRREWRVDALYTAALWGRDDGADGTSLDALSAALQRPRFTLYLGRKGGPLGLPLCPRIVDADDVAAVFAGDAGLPARVTAFLGDRILGRPGETEARGHLERPLASEIAADRGAPGVPDSAIVIRRRDRILSRRRFQFADRDEAIWTAPASALVAQVAAAGEGSGG